MCFSASASFSAGVVLSIVGVASVKKASSPSEIVFASIPLLFAIQQITEGFLWLALTDHDYTSLQQVCTYNFLFFAQVVWPVWVPFAILELDPKERRRNSEKILVVVGALVSLYLAYCLLNYRVEAKIVGYHITYEQDYPASLSRYGALLYFIATVGAPFFSRIKRMWLLGITVMISYVVTALFYTDYIVSVWCFFASVISVAVYIIMYELKKSGEVPRLEIS